MSKGALDLLTKSCALELPNGIRCNAVNPTVVLTPLGQRDWGNNPAKADPMRSRIPLERFAEESEVVGPVLFLLDQTQSGMVNGSVMAIEGGLFATLKMDGLRGK